MRAKKPTVPGEPPGEASEGLSRSTLPRPDCRPCVLVVEDQEAVRRLIVRLLQHSGRDPLVAGDGEQGFAAWQRHRDSIGLLITDLVMPEEGGVGLALRIWRDAPDLPILFLSGYQEQGAGLEDALSAGLHARFLAKPFSASELLAAVEALLQAEPPDGEGVA